MSHKLSWYSCPLCLIDFHTPENLVAHVTITHNLQECKCLFCDADGSRCDLWKDHMFENLRPEPLTKRAVLVPASPFYPRDGTYMQKLVARLAKEKDDALVDSIPMYCLYISRAGLNYQNETHRDEPEVSPEPDEKERTACGRYSYYSQKENSTIPTPEGRNEFGTGGVFGEGDVFPIPASGQPWSIVDEIGHIVKSPQEMLAERLKRKRPEDPNSPRVATTKRLKRKQPDEDSSDPEETLTKRIKKESSEDLNPILPIESKAQSPPPAPVPKKSRLPAHARFWFFEPKPPGHSHPSTKISRPRIPRPLTKRISLDEYRFDHPELASFSDEAVFRDMLLQVEKAQKLLLPDPSPSTSTSVVDVTKPDTKAKPKAVQDCTAFTSFDQFATMDLEVHMLLQVENPEKLLPPTPSPSTSTDTVDITKPETEAKMKAVQDRTVFTSPDQSTTMDLEAKPKAVQDRTVFTSFDQFATMDLEVHMLLQVKIPQKLLPPTPSPSTFSNTVDATKPEAKAKPKAVQDYTVFTSFDSFATMDLEVHYR